ncbi:hypothetical protein SNE40_010153 [Patella caerulea]|uniref:Uncharacterized protein n=1 Tax=Patella caerulea TaxID=87958 RepID=A0AAN8K0D3_PATCE
MKVSERKNTILLVVYVLFDLHVTLAADPTASIPPPSLGASIASDVSTTRPTILPVTVTTTPSTVTTESTNPKSYVHNYPPPTVSIPSTSIINTQPPTKIKVQCPLQLQANL